MRTPIARDCNIIEAIKLGDIVTRKSYNGDTYFRVDKIDHDQGMLRGLFYRLYADAPLVDLEKKNQTEIHTAYNENIKNQDRQIVRMIKHPPDLLM
jgi:spore coat assembly protein